MLHCTVLVKADMWQFHWNALTYYCCAAQRSAVQCVYEQKQRDNCDQFWYITWCIKVCSNEFKFLRAATGRETETGLLWKKSIWVAVVGSKTRTFGRKWTVLIVNNSSWRYGLRQRHCDFLLCSEPCVVVIGASGVCVCVCVCTQFCCYRQSRSPILKSFS